MPGETLSLRLVQRPRDHAPLALRLAPRDAGLTIGLMERSE
ncbi:MAG: hypothetical protein R3D02_11255 [Hyphomicrobiales bacterium]